MRFPLKAALWVAFLLSPAVSLAQGAIQQAGLVTAGHPLVWYGNGLAGDAVSPTAGGLINIMPITSASPCSSYIQNAQTITGNYATLCFGVTPSQANITLSGAGTGANLPLIFNINGTQLNFSALAPLANLPNNNVLANVSGSTAGAAAVPFTSLLTSVFGATPGQLIFSNSTGWAATTGGTNGACATYSSGPPVQVLWGSCSAGGGSGTVTSVAADGGSTGLTFSGSPITTTGDLSLGGVLDVANGGTGATAAGATAANNIGALAQTSNLSDLASVSAAQANLGLGTAALANLGTSGATVPVLNANNTFSGNTTISGTLTASGASGLSVTNNATVGGTLNVTGATSLNSSAAIAGNATVGGTLAVSGLTTVAAATGSANAPQWGQIIAGNGSTYAAPTRVLGTVYTNSTARPLWVVVTVATTGSGTAGFSVIVNSVTIAQQSLNATSGPYQLSEPFMVPAGQTYQVNSTGSGVSLTTWFEA